MRQPQFRSEQERDDFIAAATAYYNHGPKVGGKRTDFVPKSHGAPEHAVALRVLVNQPWKSFRQASRSDRKQRKEIRAVTRVKIATTTHAQRDIAIMRNMGSVHE